MTDLRIGFIGSGNLAWNLAAGLRDAGYAIRQVISRRESRAQELASHFGILRSGQDLAALEQDLDLVILAVADDAVEQVATALASLQHKAVFVHTSGSVPLSALAPLGERIGVFYPMQTFTRGHEAELRQVPFYLEGNAEVLGLIRPVAEALSERVRELDSAGRLRLHLGAVFASNFANFMWLQAEDMVRAYGLDLSAYGHLIREMVEKSLAMGPEAAQTGPAKRGDEATMSSHLHLLEEQGGEAAEIYRMLSEAIRKRWS